MLKEANLARITTSIFPRRWGSRLNITTAIRKDHDQHLARDGEGAWLAFGAATCEGPLICNGDGHNHMATTNKEHEPTTRLQDQGTSLQKRWLKFHCPPIILNVWYYRQLTRDIKRERLHHSLLSYSIPCQIEVNIAPCLVLWLVGTLLIEIAIFIALPFILKLSWFIEPAKCWWLIWDWLSLIYSSSRIVVGIWEYRCLT